MADFTQFDIVLTGQISFGSYNQQSTLVNVVATAPAAVRTHTIPDPGANAYFMMTTGNSNGQVGKAKEFQVNVGVASAALANGTVFTYLIAPGRAGVVTQIMIAAKTKPVGGVNTVTVKKNSGNTMLSAANFDPTSITTSGVAQALALTATPADLALVATDIIEVIYTSGTQGTAAVAPTLTIEMLPTDY